MTTLDPSDSYLTLINTFHVKPERADALVEVLTRATRDTMEHMPGFVSANIHKSLDGKRVVNYAQWRSKTDFEAMLKNPEAQPHMKEAAALAESFEPTLYSLIFADAK